MRWPVPEMLIGRQKERYYLKIDEILAESYSEETIQFHANYKPEINAPNNSVDSGDNFDLYQTSTDDEEFFAPESPLKGMNESDPNWFDEKLLDVSPFRMDKMKYFPYRAREGDIPLKILNKESIEYLVGQAPIILAQQKKEKWN